MEILRSASLLHRRHPQSAPLKVPKSKRSLLQTPNSLPNCPKLKQSSINSPKSAKPKRLQTDSLLPPSSMASSEPYKRRTSTPAAVVAAVVKTLRKRIYHRKVVYYGGELKIGLRLHKAAEGVDFDNEESDVEE